MRAIDLTNVTEAGTNDFLKAGGYVCRITKVSDLPDKQYLMVEYDVAEGKYKDYYKKLEESKGFWGGSTIKSYKETALPMFKRFCSAVTKSNPGFIFDGGANNADESTLVGKYIGLVLFEEEYMKNNGDVGTRLKVSYECDIDKIRKGDFKIPEKKYLNQNGTANPTDANGFSTVPNGVDDEIPFN